MAPMLSRSHRNQNDSACRFGCCHNSKFHQARQWATRKERTRRVQRRRENRAWRREVLEY